MTLQSNFQLETVLSGLHLCISSVKYDNNAKLLAH